MDQIQKRSEPLNVYRLSVGRSDSVCLTSLTYVGPKSRAEW